MVSSKMDINSLLSPELSPKAGTNYHQQRRTQQQPQQPQPQSQPATVERSTGKRSQKPRSRKEQPLLQQATAPPARYSRDHLLPVAPHGHANPPLHGSRFTTSPSLSTSSMLSPAPSTSSIVISPSMETRDPMFDVPRIDTPPPSLRHQTSNAMDFLADVAAMQSHQQTVPQISLSHRADVQELNSAASAHADATRSRPSPPNRRISVIPSSLDQPMSDAPTAVLKPRNFSSISMSDIDLELVQQLTQQISENTWLYEVHMQLINVLHHGFVAHLQAVDGGGAPRDPNSWPLLQDLRQARLAMDSRFLVGEELWVDWLNDECVLATKVEDKVAILELCQKAVQDEVGSAKLWRFYGDWMWLVYRKSRNIDVPLDTMTLEDHPIIGPHLAQQKWTEEDKVVAEEVFGWDLMLDVWRQGVAATQWHINDSNLLFDGQMEVLMFDLARAETTEKINHVGQMFHERLQQPHATYEDTFQKFSQYVSKYSNHSYEEIMVSTTHKSKKTKQEYALRDPFERRILYCQENNDRDAEHSTFREYMEWEIVQSKKRHANVHAFHLLVGLSERANLRFPADPSFWEDHVSLVTETPTTFYPLLAVVERATRHCPWSGELWSKRLYALEASEKDFQEISDVKHRATASGLLEEAGGVDELIKIHIAWCGFLRRRAFASGASEDEVDMAEVGIRSAIENIKEIGVKKYGEEFRDPGCRIEKIYCKFLAQARRFDEARAYWKTLISTHGDYADFWERYYLWEMIVWGIDLGKAQSSGQPVKPPAAATAVLQTAIMQPNLDWPEKLIDSYKQHCAQQETVHKVQDANVRAAQATKLLIARRERERLAAETAGIDATSTGRHGQAEDTAMVDEPGMTGKRKREIEIGEDGPVADKRIRGNDDITQAVAENASSSTATQQAKRDRENTTVVVSNIPLETTETRIRQFFRDCGKILSLSLLSDNETSTASATVEFEFKEDALAAATRHGKMLDNSPVDVQIGTGTTVWITNYPPEADESFLRDLFNEFGDIVDIRMPSLQKNAFRRFCYIQFLTQAQAKAATRLNGKSFGGKYVLTAAISNPGARKDRESATEEGREVRIGNLDRTATDKEVQELFEAFGTVLNVRILRNMAGKSKGSAFIVFKTKAEAQAALTMDKKDFKSTILTVEIARTNANGPKRKLTTIINSAGSPGADSADGTTNNEAHAVADDAAATERAQNYKARSVAILDLPDTVGDKRVQVFMEQVGPLAKVVLRPEKGGAIVEFAEVADAGRAEMMLTGKEIAPGRAVRIGSVAELLRDGRPDKKDDKASGSAGGGKQKTSALSMAPARRPQQQPGGLRRGGRGGLGFKRTGNVVGERTEANGAAGHDAGATSTPAETEKKGGKSQADFRALLGA